MCSCKRIFRRETRVEEVRAPLIIWFSGEGRRGGKKTAIYTADLHVCCTRSKNQKGKRDAFCVCIQIYIE